MQSEESQTCTRRQPHEPGMTGNDNREMTITHAHKIAEDGMLRLHTTVFCENSDMSITN